MLMKKKILYNFDHQYTFVYLKHKTIYLYCSYYQINIQNNLHKQITMRIYIISILY